MTDVAGRRVLITGASHGIGRILAILLAELGSNLILWDRDAKALEELKSVLPNNGTSARCVICDLAYSDAVENTAKAIIEEYGSVDIIINNAGIVYGESFTELSFDKVELTFQVNAIAPINIIRAFLPCMLLQGNGHIVNISSAAGMIGIPRLSVYSATKAALFTFNDALRMELKSAGLNIKTTIVCPYFIDTEMFEGVVTRFKFLLPVLKKEYVAERIVKAILSDKESVFIPPYIVSVLPARLLPVSIFDRCIKWLGLWECMRGFAGKRSESTEEKSL